MEKLQTERGTCSGKVNAEASEAFESAGSFHTFHLGGVPSANANLYIYIWPSCFKQCSLNQAYGTSAEASLPKAQTRTCLSFFLHKLTTSSTQRIPLLVSVAAVSLVMRQAESHANNSKAIQDSGAHCSIQFIYLSKKLLHDSGESIIDRSEIAYEEGFSHV